MPQPPSITLDPAPHPALSYAGLRAEALELLGRLCGERWSDFNSHDPGITILEQLCYALTELAWRCQWPIADLLANADGDWQPTAEQILHGDPVTRDDLLALLRALGCQAVVLEGADQPDLPLYFRPTTVARALPAAAAGPPVAGDLELDATLVAGLAATPPDPVVPRGVWRVAAQLGSGAPGQGPASLQPIARRLHGVRLLGRDFSLEALTPFEVVVKAELELVAPEVPPDLPSRLRARLDAVISAVDAAGEPGGLRGAHLIQSLQGLPEVRRVIALSLASSPAGPFHPWHLALPGRGARLHPASPISFSHRGLSLAPPPALPAASAPSLAPGSMNGGRASAASPPVSPTPPPATTGPSGAGALGAGVAAVRTGRRLALASHRSLARLLPAVYGVGPAGLPADASPERRAQALQLRAYLLLFDQLLANSQAQLAHAARLLSPLPPGDPHPLDAEGLLGATDRDLPLTDLTELLQGAPAAWPDQLRQALRASAPPSAAGQRAALLAHLLRLFGEELSLETRPAAANGSGLATAEVLDTRLVTARSEFLRRIVPLTAGRGSGPDLLAPAPQPASPAASAATPVGGDAGEGPCAERLRRKLGLPFAADGTPPLLVIEHLLLRPLADDSGQRVQGGEDPIPFLSDVARPDPWSGRVSVVINAACLPAMADAERDRWLVRLLRQELPAHLLVELHLLADGSAAAGPGPWSTLLAAWRRFRALLHTHRLAGLGDPGAQAGADPLAPLLLSLRFRDSRDQLLSLLRIGLPWPLRAIPLPDQILVASGQTGAITLPYSQRGVRYQLVEVATGAPVGTSAEGTDGPLTLPTPPINDDITLRVLASVLPPRPPGAPPETTAVALTASGRARSTLLVGEIRVVEGVDVRLPLRLLDQSFMALPRLHPDGEALLANHDQRLLVEVEASQEGVVYEVIDDSQRDLPFELQTPLSAKVVGTSRAIRLELYASAAEDRDLAVRASLEKRRGRARAEDRRILTAILPLRVRANPAVPLRLRTPVVNAGASAIVAIGAAAGPAASVSQVSVHYLLQARVLADADWRFDNPAATSALTTISGPLEGFTPQRASGPGNGAMLSLEQPVSGEGTVVAALARKEHRLSPFSATDARTVASEVPLRQAAVAYTRPEAQRRVLLLRDAENPSLWSFWGGQPGVAYTLRPEAERLRITPIGPSLALPEGNDAAGGVRGIGRVRVERDLVVDATTGTPPAELTADPAGVGELRFWAHFLRSGVEVALEHPPILVWAEPPGVCQGESARVVVSRLDPAQRGRLLRDTTLLRDGAADATGNLSLSTGPLPGASRLQLDVGVTCSLWIAQAVTLDLPVRVRDHQPLLEGTPAHLVDWGGGAVVELATSQAEVTYTLINASDRDKPLQQQPTFCAAVPGTGGALVLRCEGLREDVDLLVRGTRVYDAAGTQHSTGYLTTIVPLRVRANPAVPLRLLTPVVDADALASVAIGAEPDVAANATPSGEPAAFTSQASARYLLHTRPLADADWRFDNPAAEPALTTITGPLEGFTSDPHANGPGNGAALILEPAISGEGMVVAALAQKEHRVHPFSAADGRTVASTVPLRQAAVAYTRPDAKRRTILRRDALDPSLWALWGGQPGVAYTLWPAAERGGSTPMGPPLALPEGGEAPGGLRGIGRARVARDLVVEAVDGVPQGTFHLDPAQETAPRLWARFHRSGVEVLLELSPTLEEPPPPTEGSSLRRGRMLRRDDEVSNAPLPPLEGGVITDLPVRVPTGESLADGAEARLLDWDGSVAVEVADSQSDVVYTLINATDRDLPVERQTTLCPSLRGTGGVLGLRCEGLREDVDLLVRGTPVVDDVEQWSSANVLTTAVLLRVRPNPAVPVSLVEPLLDPASDCGLWVGDGALPSQASVTYGAWWRPLTPEDWDSAEAASESIAEGIVRAPRLPSAPPAASLADAGWVSRGEPQPGTDGDVSQGDGGRLRLSLGPAEADAALAVVATKWHNPGPLADPATPGVASATVLQPLVAQLTRPDPERRLALVSGGRGWRLVGGEPGTFYTLQGPSDGAMLGTPMYVHLRTLEDPPRDRGLGWQRLGRDTVVASAAGPGFGVGPNPSDLQTAVVEARRALSGATNRLRCKLLVVVPLYKGDACHVILYGLAPDERCSVRQLGSEPPGQPNSVVGVQGDRPVRLNVLSVPTDTDLTLEVRQEGTDCPWTFTVRLLRPGTSPP